LQNNCLGCDQATGFCNSCQTNFTLNTTSFVCEISNFNINSSNITNLTSLTNLNNTNITNSNFTSPTNMNSTNSLSRNLSSFGNYTNSSNYSTTISNNSYIGDVSTVESRIVNFETSGLENISPIIGFIYMILQMSPFAILFLSFINYWNFCCLYSILDIKVPLYLPNAHQIIFNSTQTSIFTVLNYNPSLPVLENQNV
jgi:hypothetical protein